MTTSFSAQVDEIIAKSEKNMLLLLKQSVSDVIDGANTSTSKGGRMRRDTGFLNASGVASLTGMPSGPGRGESKIPDFYKYEDSNVIATIGQLKLGSTIFYGWTANYAKYRELKDGFLAAELQNWQAIVNKNANEIKKRSKL